MAREHPVTLARRAVLGGLCVPIVVLSGCSRILVHDLPTEDITPPPLNASSELRIALFEVRPVGLPFHAGLIIHSPHERVIFDPLGAWESDSCERQNDMLRNPSAQVEAAYLARSGDFPLQGAWTLHLFEIAVAPEVAMQAVTLAAQTPDLPPLHCAFAVSSLLAQLPGFDFVEPNVVTADLYRTLRARPQFRYTRQSLPRGVKAG